VIDGGLDGLCGKSQGFVTSKRFISIPPKTAQIQQKTESGYSIVGWLIVVSQVETTACDMQTQVRVALGGGGGANDSRLLDEVFATWIGSHGTLLYWPIAFRGIHPFPSCLEWITSTLAPWHITHITMWSDLSEHQASELEEFDAVFIGGGNTFALLAQLQESGFERYLRAYVQRGKAVYGSSAGAAVLGRDIRTVSHLDRNDVGLTETRGLDLAEGHAIWVHYQPQEDDLIDAYVRQYQQPVLAISERSGIVIEATGMRSVGFEPAYRFDRQGKSNV
jgi:dipeptidase E